MRRGPRGPRGCWLAGASLLGAALSAVLLCSAAGSAAASSLHTGAAINVFSRYGYFAISMRVVPRNETDRWIFREPSVNVFKNITALPPRSPSAAARHNGRVPVFEGDFHMEFCDNLRQLLQAYFRDFQVERLERPWSAFTASWSRNAMAKHLGLNATYVAGSHCYVLVSAGRTPQRERPHGPRAARGARRGLRGQGPGPRGARRHGVGRGVGQEFWEPLRSVLCHGQLVIPGVRVHAAHLPSHQGAPQDPGRGRAVCRRAGQLLQPLVRGAHGPHPVRVGQLHGGGVGRQSAPRQLLLLRVPEPHQAAWRRRPAQDPGRLAAERGRAAAGPAHPGARVPESGEAAMVQRGCRQPAQAVGGQHVVKRDPAPCHHPRLPPLPAPPRRRDQGPAG